MARKPWAKSTGPRTAAGKARSSQNAYKTGRRSAARAYFNTILRRQSQFLRDLRDQLKNPPVSRRVLECHREALLSSFDVRGSILAALVGDVERNFLTFIQTAQASFFNCRDVNEHVARTIFRLNEAEAFLGIKPFNSTVSHSGLLVDKHFIVRETPYNSCKAGFVSGYSDVLEVAV